MKTRAFQVVFCARVNMIVFIAKPITVTFVSPMLGIKCCGSNAGDQTGADNAPSATKRKTGITLGGKMKLPENQPLDPSVSVQLHEQSHTRPRKRLWHNILFMTLNPLAAAILMPLYVYYCGISWGHVILLLVTYTISNMCITSGYHRYFSHRSYEAHPLIEWLYVFIGAGAFQGTMLTWCTDHRRHHAKVDSDEDPYSINKGFWYAHLLWMFYKDPHPDACRYPADLTKNRWVMFQHRHYVWIAAFVGFILPGLIAWSIGLGFWGGVIFGGSLRIVLSQQSTFFINSVVHMFGSQPYSDKNTARDNTLMAFFTFGEGYHNFHHAFQADYRNGIRWYQWDPTKWWIQALGAVGLARRLKQARRDEILKARLAMDERHMVSRGISKEFLESLKERLVRAQARMRQLREDTTQAQTAFRERRKQMSSEMRRQMQAHFSRLKKQNHAELRVVKNDFKLAYSQWRSVKRNSRRAALAA